MRCLITDIERQYFDPQDHLLWQEPILGNDNDLGRIDVAWHWHIAPLGELSRDYRCQHQMIARIDQD